MATKTSDAARQKRVTKADVRDAQYMIERKRIEAANAEKTVRLRTLRLAKEATERETALKEAAERDANLPPPKSRKKKTVPNGTDRSGE